MLKNNNFLCVLLMLTGCSHIHLGQHNILPSSSSPLPPNIDIQAAWASVHAHDSDLYTDLAHLLYALDDSNTAPDGAIDSTDSHGSPSLSAQDAANQAIRSFDKLIQTFRYVMGLNANHGLVGGLNTNNGVDAIIDIQARATEDHITLMPGFANLHAALANRSYRSCTQEDLAGIASAYSVYALRMAYAATGCARGACQTANRLAADPMTTPDHIDLTRAAADKATLAASMDAIAAYLIAAFVAESYAVSHAISNTARAYCNAIDMVADYLTAYSAERSFAAAKAAADQANKAAEAACTVANLALRIAGRLASTIVDSANAAALTTAVVRVVEAAAARAKAAAAAARINLDITRAKAALAGAKANHEFPLANYIAQGVCFQTADSEDKYANAIAHYTDTIVKDANAIATTELDRAIAISSANANGTVLKLALVLAEVARAAHRIKVLSSSSAT